MAEAAQTLALAIRKQLKLFGDASPTAWSDPSNINRLCPRCQTCTWDAARTYLLLADDYSFYPKVGLYQTAPEISQIRHEAHAGCHLCTFVLSCLLSMRYRTSVGVDPVPEGLQEIRDTTRVMVSVEAMAKEPPVWLTVGIEDHGVLRGWLDVSTPIVTSLSASIGRPGLSSAFDVARYWLEDCLRNHTPCHGESVRSPRRIVDVSGSKLRLREDVSDGCPYAALSYKIGNVGLFTTTSTTIEERRDGFDIGLLPQTVRDAVQWTRALGLSFLWIDSLCILQDNLDDWEQELSSMEEVYRNATVVIAAAASESASEGCLPVDNRLAKTACEPTPGLFIVPDFERDRWIHAKGGLDSRAWTFQEVQLGTRVLRVGGEEISWQCRKCKRRETQATEERTHDIQADGFSLGSRALDARRIMARDPFRAWYVLARDFNSRHLSFSADRLPAFSGMAKLFRGELDARYVCGLWEEDLRHGLLWRSTHPGTFVPSRAPSWSWVAIEGNQLVWAWDLLRCKEDEIAFEVLEVRVNVPGLNPFGRVSSARLVVTGPVTPLPSFLCGDECAKDVPEFQWPLVMFDTDRLPGVCCVLLRMHQRFCLILEPTGNRLYRRVGSLITPGDFHRRQREIIEVLDSYSWVNRVLTII